MKKLFFRLFTLAVGCFFAWLLQIDPGKEYGWFMGIIHSWLLVPNWIISWFKSGWLIIAPLHTTAYMVFLWIHIVLSVLFYGGFALIRLIFRK